MFMFKHLFAVLISCVLILWLGSAAWIHDIKHNINWDSVTLSWDIDSGDEKAGLYLWGEWAVDEFKKLWVVDSFAKKYTFSLTKSWEFIVRFVPNSWWEAVNYTFDTKSSSSGIDDFINGILGGDSDDDWINISEDELDKYHPKPDDIEDLANNKITTVPKTWPMEIGLISLVLWTLIYFVYRTRKAEK